MTKTFCDRCGAENRKGREVNKVYISFSPNSDFDVDYFSKDLCPACTKDLRTLVTERDCHRRQRNEEIKYR